MLEQRLAEARVLPVITARDEESTVKLAAALQGGGMRAVEITLRTPAALAAIAAVKAALPGLTVAAGTVNTPADVERVAAAGVDLALSPGATPALLAAAADAPLDFVPGVATASEILQAQAYGFTLFKLFPAEASGGPAALKSLGGPCPEARVCPTGGLTQANFRDYLALDNVVCCGGSWMVTRELIDNGRWDEVAQLAAEAMA